MQTATAAFKTFRLMPAPQRGEIVRQFGENYAKQRSFRKIGFLWNGESLQEGYGEVQEMIDICDFAVGLSRQLHRIDDAFWASRTQNVWAIPFTWGSGYHFCLQLSGSGLGLEYSFGLDLWWCLCLETFWKNASLRSSLSKYYCGSVKRNNLPEGISCLINGDYTIGELLTKDTRVPLISATGSTRMGKIVAQTVAGRLGKSLLELGGKQCDNSDSWCRYQNDCDWSCFWRCWNRRTTLYLNPKTNYPRKYLWQSKRRYCGCLRAIENWKSIDEKPRGTTYWYTSRWNV